MSAQVPLRRPPPVVSGRVSLVAALTEMAGAGAAAYFIWTRRLRAADARSSPEAVVARTHQW